MDSRRVLFATWEAFWLDAREHWLVEIYHPFYPDDNERLENHVVCSDKALFFPPMAVED